MTNKILISDHDYAPKRNWNEKPGIRTTWEELGEWYCAVACTAFLWWFVGWVLPQAWRFLKQGG